MIPNDDLLFMLILISDQRCRLNIYINVDVDIDIQMDKNIPFEFKLT